MSLTARAALAVLLMIGFYAIALGIGAGLIAIPVGEFVYLERIDPRIAFFCLAGAFAILRSIVPRPDRFEAPGPTLTEKEQPRLFAAISDVARATDQSMPAEVYLVPQVNAWVAQRGGVMGVGSRRVMGLGLPLLQGLSVNELRAVLAHEFGHFHAGDTALGPWIYKTRSAIGRTLASLSQHSSVLMKPFEWYGAGFLRITHAISRRQEYAADALAAKAVGPTPLATGLRKIHGVDAAFVPYFFGEVAPLLERGYRPPIAAGFDQFLTSPLIAPQVSAAVEQAMNSPSKDPYDTHPPLAERVAALGVAGAAPDEGARALSLLENVDDLESRLVAHMSQKKSSPPPVPIAWSVAGEKVWAGVWRERVRIAGSRLQGITISQVPSIAADLPGAAVRFGFAPDRARAEEGAGNVVDLLGGAIAVQLLNRGWQVSSLPGSQVIFSRDGATVTPFSDIVGLASKRIDAAAWSAAWNEVGLGDLPLV